MTMPLALARSSYVFLHLPEASYLSHSSRQMSSSCWIRCSMTLYAPFSWASVHFLQPVSMASTRCSVKEIEYVLEHFFFHGTYYILLCNIFFSASKENKSYSFSQLVYDMFISVFFKI